MAKINPIHGELSGSIAGNTYARNSYGSYVRRKVSPVQPSTPDQTLIRERMTGLSKQWGQTLTAAQRGSWEQLAGKVTFPDVFGNPQKLSGISLRNKLGMQALTCGDTPLNDAPADLEVRPLISAALANVAGGGNTFDVQFTDDCTATERLVVMGAVNVQPGVNFVEDKMVFMAASATNQATDWTVTLPAKFGNLTTGSQLIVRVKRYNQANSAYSSGIVVKAVIT